MYKEGVGGNNAGNSYHFSHFAHLVHFLLSKTHYGKTWRRLCIGYNVVHCGLSNNPVKPEKLRTLMLHRQRIAHDGPSFYTQLCRSKRQLLDRKKQLSLAFSKSSKIVTSFFFSRECCRIKAIAVCA